MFSAVTVIPHGSVLLTTILSVLFTAAITRFIQRVTECVPIKDSSTYDHDYKSEKTMDGKVEKFFQNATTYFSKVTEQKLFAHRNILEYVDGGYVITNKISDKNLQEMRENMDESDVEGFDEFVERHWGNQIKKTKKVKIEE